jgi:hypothetical protein
MVAIARWAGSYNSDWIGVVNVVAGLASAIFLASGVWIRELAVRGQLREILSG